MYKRRKSPLKRRKRSKRRSKSIKRRSKSNDNGILDIFWEYIYGPPPSPPLSGSALRELNKIPFEDIQKELGKWGIKIDKKPCNSRNVKQKIIPHSITESFIIKQKPPFGERFISSGFPVLIII